MPETGGAEAAPLLLLVDGHAYAYRAFHAIRSLNGPDGAPTNAIYGFVKMTQKMIATLKPTHLLVVWDAGLAAERMALLPGYKATRPPTPDALERQFGEIDAWLEASRHPAACPVGTPSRHRGLTASGPGFVIESGS